MAVPGVVTSKIAEGTNNLIKNNKAVMVTSAQDVLNEMGLGVGQMKIGFGTKLPISPILTALESGEKSADELARILKIPVPKLMQEMFHLQLDALVEERAGKYMRVV